MLRRLASVARAVAAVGAATAVTAIGAARVAEAQSIEELQARKGEKPDRLVDAGMTGLFEFWSGLNRDRYDAATWFMVSPHLKVGPAFRASLSLLGNCDLTDRMDNRGWSMEDPFLELSYHPIWKEPVTGITFSTRARYYFPVSKDSRNAGSRGMARFFGKVSVAVWKMYFSLEFDGRKHFSRYTTWPTGEDPGSEAWVRQAGRDDYVENNVSHGFGETLTVSYTPVDGLDLSLIGSLIQSRKHDPGEAHPEASGSSFVAGAARMAAPWEHSYRLIADVTWGVGSIPAIERSDVLKDSVLSRIYLSIGYYVLKPQLVEGRFSPNPFDARFGQVYFDIAYVE